MIFYFQKTYKYQNLSKDKLIWKCSKVSSILITPFPVNESSSKLASKSQNNILIKYNSWNSVWIKNEHKKKLTDTLKKSKDIQYYSKIMMLWKPFIQSYKS